MIGAILVDGGNMSFALKRHTQSMLPERIDYGKLPRMVRRQIGKETGKEVNFNFLCYYSGHRGQADLDKRKPFSTMLKGKGWSVFDVQAKYIPAISAWKDDQTDLTMALDGYDLVLRDQVACLVIVSHDSDFSALFRRVPATTLKYAVGWKDSMSEELVKFASPIFLEDHWKEIEYGKA